MMQSRRASKARGICVMGRKEAGQSSAFLRRLEKGQNILGFTFFPWLTLSLTMLLHQDGDRAACSPARPGLGLIFIGGLISSEAVTAFQTLCGVHFHSCMWPDLHECTCSRAYPCTSATS